MPEAIFDITADVGRESRASAVAAKQYDRDSRFLRVHILNRGRPITVAQESNVIISVERPDGEAKAFSGEVNPDGSVTVPLNGWALALEGELRCDISIIGADGSRLTTTAFGITVERPSYSGEDVSQDDTSMDIIAEVLTEVNNRMPNYKIGPGLAVSDNTLYVTAGSDGEGVAVDPTLSLEGLAADAKATGEAIRQIVEAEEAEKAWDSGLWTLDPWLYNAPADVSGYGNCQSIQLEPNTKYTVSISEDDGWTLYVDINGESVAQTDCCQTFTTDDTGLQRFWLIDGRRYDDYVSGKIKACIVKGGVPKAQGEGVIRLETTGWAAKTYENQPGALNNRFMDIYSPFGKYFSFNTGAYNDDPSDGNTWCGLTIGQPDYSGATEAGIHLAVPGSGMDFSFLSKDSCAVMDFNMGINSSSLESGRYIFAFNEPEASNYPRFQVLSDAVPVYLTAGGIKVKNSNIAAAREDESDWKTVDLFELEARVAALEANAGTNQS